MAEIKEQKKSLGRGLGSLLGDSYIDDFKATLPASFTPAPPQGTKPAATAASAPVAATSGGMASTKIQNTAPAVPEHQRVWDIDIEKIIPNEFQPRKTFVAEKIADLTASIKEKGILQPITVRKKGLDKFEIIAGERRWRAAQAAGLEKVPAIIKAVDDQESLELALIENLQRHDLNPIEEAEAYQQLADEFYLSQEEISKKVGKQRATVANTLRLLSLEKSVKEMLVSGELTPGHAKALLALNDQSKQKELAKKITSEKLTVRAAEKLIQSQAKRKTDTLDQVNVAASLVKGLEEDLTKKLGTKVEISYNKGQGNIAIRFYSDEDLTRIIERIKN